MPRRSYFSQITRRAAGMTSVLHPPRLLMRTGDFLPGGRDSPSETASTSAPSPAWPQAMPTRISSDPAAASELPSPSEGPDRVPPVVLSSAVSAAPVRAMPFPTAPPLSPPSLESRPKADGALFPALSPKAAAPAAIHAIVPDSAPPSVPRQEAAVASADSTPAIIDLLRPARVDSVRGASPAETLPAETPATVTPPMAALPQVPAVSPMALLEQATVRAFAPPASSQKSRPVSMGEPDQAPPSIRRERVSELSSDLVIPAQSWPDPGLPVQAPTPKRQRAAETHLVLEPSASSARQTFATEDQEPSSPTESAAPVHRRFAANMPMADGSAKTKPSQETAIRIGTLEVQVTAPPPLPARPVRPPVTASLSRGFTSSFGLRQV